MSAPATMDKPATAARPKTSAARCHTPGGQLLGNQSSREAQRAAALILEVLAGGRTPTQAAEALSVSLPRYYQLETRAVDLAGNHEDTRGFVHGRHEQTWPQAGGAGVCATLAGVGRGQAAAAEDPGNDDRPATGAGRVPGTGHKRKSLPATA